MDSVFNNRVFENNYYCDIKSQQQHDIDLITKHMYDTFRWYGVPVLIRRQFNLDDFKAGKCDRCSCYNENYSQSASNRCPKCYGTSFDGGYTKPEFIYITQAGNIGHEEQHKDKQGYREEQDQTRIALVADELYRDGDVFARITGFNEEGLPESIDEVWQIDGKVARQEEWGMSEPYLLEFGREYKRVERLITMTASAKILLKTDPRRKEEFWGL